MKNNAKRFAREFLFINLVSFTGACIIFLFQFLISKVKELVFLPIKTTPINIVIYLLFILLVSFIEYMLLKKKSYIRKKLNYGSFLSRHRIIDSIIEVIESIFCCLLTFMIALPLGSEGPSVYVGFMVENFFCLLLYKKETTLAHNHFGSMMGYSLAFLNPLAGFFFYFEKKNRRGTSKRMFYQMYLLLTSFAWILLWRYLYGIKDFYHYSLYNPNLSFFSQSRFDFLIFAIPLITMFLSFFYKRCILGLAYFVKANNRCEVAFSLIMTIMTVLPLKFTGMYSYLGFADEIFLSTEELLFEGTLLFFFIRFFWTIFSNDIYYQGGHVIPTFVVGGSIGMVIASLLSKVYPLTREDQSLIIVLAALSFFASVTMNFLTTLSLCLSFGPGSVLIPYMIVPLSMIYITAKLFHRPSLPELLEHVKNINNEVKRSIRYYKAVTKKH